MEKIIIVKIGSSILMTKENQLDEIRISHIADQILSLREKGSFIVLVVSGAVACGANFVTVFKNKDHLRQIAAGIGQTHIISKLKDIFAKRNIEIAQVLLTKEYLQSKKNAEEMQEVLLFYLANGFLPILNENDIVDLNSFGGNDLLAAHVAGIVQAEKLIILSTMEGSIYGIGGGETKQEALRLLAKQNIKASIVNGKAENILLQTVL